MGKKIKLPLENGLAALCNHIKAIKQTAEQSGSAVSALAQATAGSIEEIEGILSEKQDASNAVPFTVPAAGWASEEIDENGEGEADMHEYSYYYDLAVGGITAKDRVDVTISPGSIGTATVCGLCPTTETLAGKIRLRSASRPNENIAAEYWLCSGKE
ncbi:hypothetical protein [uncultured Oscillibacter sp.]|uniref:hypothetical protein n=1 Tax=uncultured Oscillibacter sp. TaxID=876091 RepID=UPI0025DD6647|nr:hypothetical protein [uncultured Oscillibacter sp.]